MPSPSPAYTPLPSSSRAFDEALFRSTLGSPPTTSRGALSLPPKYEAVAPVSPTGQIYLTLETVMEDEEDVSSAEMDEASKATLEGLERGLYGYSCASLFLTALYFSAASFSSPISSFLPPAPILALAAYISILFTFRAGVRRIALAVDEPRVGGRIELEEEGLPPVEEDESTREGRLEGGKGVCVQGLTLLAAAALMHLPVHALNTLPLGIGFAAWCCSTCLAGLMMYDAVNRAAASAEAEKESAGLTWVGGYITKA